MGSTSRRLDWPELPALFPCFPGSERWLPVLERHWALVEEWNERASLTSVKGEETVRRNYAESLEIWAVLGDEGGVEAVGDVGSGAGFPGLVGAVVSPEAQVHLIEPRRKRAAFLSHCVGELELQNVTVHGLRAEEAGRGVLRERLTRVVARAVAPLPVLLEYVAPLLAVDGLAVLPRGSSAKSEVEAAEPAAGAVGLKLTRLVSLRAEVSATPFAVCYRKVGTTPERFPRRPGVAARRPLP